MILKEGDRSETVRTIQEWLNELGYKYKTQDSQYLPLKTDGIFGQKTEDVIIDFQDKEGLYTDGIVGPNTFKALENSYYEIVKDRDSPGDSFLAETDFSLEKVPADIYDQGYDRLQLRNDVAEAYRKVRVEVLAQGGILTSSGGMRSLKANLNANRSAVSFHYVGRALDLFVYSAMVDHVNDPYVVTWDNKDERYFTIYARCKKNWPINPKDKTASITLPNKITLKNVITYKKRNPDSNAMVIDHFLNLTDIFKKHGFKNIKGRRKFFSGGSELGAEWWHFQYEKGLMPKVSTFGEELLKIYSENTLIGTPPWIQKDKIFGINWF